jgi:hypothetical protein
VADSNQKTRLMPLGGKEHLLGHQPRNVDVFTIQSRALVIIGYQIPCLLDASGEFFAQDAAVASQIDHHDEHEVH